MKQTFLLVALLSLPASADEPSRISVVDTFEEWEWKPITDPMRREGRRRLAENRELNFAYRGPLYRGPVGFILPAGVIVEGDDAFEGKSTVLADCQVGLHGRYSQKIRPSAGYDYSLAIKGRGKFQFRAWVLGIDVKQGEQSWLGFPNLIEIEATESWQTHSGTFKLPSYDDKPGFRLPKAVSAAIVIDKGDRVFLDNFKFEERRPAAQP